MYSKHWAIHLIWGVVLIWLAILWCVGPKSEPALERVLEWPELEADADEIRATRDRAIATAARELDVILAQPPADVTFESTLLALDALDHEYSKHWDRMELLQYASPDDAVRDAASEASVAMEKWYVENIALSERLYALIQAFSHTEEAEHLSGEDRLLLDETLDDYRREGLTLSSEDRAQIASWRSRLAELDTQIGLNINADEGIVAFERDDLQGLTDEDVRAFERDEATGRYLVRTALRSQYDLVMKHAVRSETRRRALEANLRRAMDENAELILEVLQLRTRMAELLGYETWADVQTEPRMAGSAEVAQSFLLDLSQRLEGSFRAEQIRLRDLAREELDDPSFEVDDLGVEDIPYYTNMLLEREYAIDEQVVREYFAEQELLRRIFDLCEEVFSLEIVIEEPEHTWAEDVQVAMVSDASTGSLLGAIYLDLHPRAGKYTHFATFELVGGRRLSEQRYQAPICAIVGNFPVPVGEQPSLWSLANVTTMLHELGHALHCVLTQASHFEHAGIGVPWDFVEVPSQSLERWLEDPALLGRLAVHYQTGEAMPAELIERITTTTRVGIGHFYRRQIGFGMLDLAIHTYTSLDELPATSEQVYEATNAIFGESYYEVPDDTALLASFEHLFDGYDAGYYSYAWSDAIVANFASLFRQSEQGFMDPQLGARLRKEILEVGGSRPVEESIRAFLGRDWTLEVFFEELLGGQ